MFEKILIANRGEIACRIIRTCRRMGIRTVAVYSEADAGALHVQLADEACCIGKSAPAESYLRIGNVLDAAKKHGAQAIHPGYGFLSENAEFARQCSKSRIVFIGPSAEAIEQMGAKDQAKCVMENAGVPVVPGYKGAEQSPEFLHAEAEKIGYPLMIKAVLGGGGKGMRVVRKQTDFTEALESARNEARNAFGDDLVLLECFVSGPRHIEFQIFGDQHGNVIHLFERDCSLQRRHQKIIEESPSPFLDDELRSSMAEAAVAAAKAVKYTGAGTVEFIVGDDRGFFFMEMNTRLQVEHPVTEMISGLDLVEWQLRVAADEKLPLTQHEVNQTGHAIEARIYAENPETGFLPSIGTLQRLALPETFQKIKNKEDNNSQSWSSIRIDSGVEQGGEISIHYDPLIAKLVVHADSRKQAIRTMQTALAQSGVLGVETNLGFLQSILQHPYFDAGKMDTLFVDSNLESLLEENQDSVDWVCWGTAIACLLKDYAESETKAQESMEPCSPWNSLNNWRTGFPEPHRVQLRNQQGTETEVMIIKENNSFRILNETEGILVTVSRHGDLLDLSWNSSGLEEYGHHLLVLSHESQLLAVHEDGRTLFTRLDPLTYEQSEDVSDFRLSAPMPGNVIRVLVKAGDEVSSGQPLLVLEAMKMEHTIVAPANGIVEEVLFQPGDLVQNDAKLVEFSLLDE
ncbi:MAG: acetyl/propionyl/methylcrotonyl-CoA carboxylase subunit alpha [SAR324 cluster bacterium]|nr:acetyl/propionyl/methylcrotonyl-CoA carboxylase subunit alpha [SAR324 cluster bacterium]